MPRAPVVTFDDVTPALLDRYLTGECTPEEVRLVHAALDADGEVRAVLGQLRELRQAAELDAPWDVVRMWRRVVQALDGDAVQEAVFVPHPQERVSAVIPPNARQYVPTLRRNRGDSYLHRTWLSHGATSALAAALLLAVGGTWAVRRAARRTVIPTPIVAYTTAPGQRATITLTDGSTVQLNVASRLEVPADYAAGDRTVRLVGEGLFSVAHAGGKPFTVQSGPTSTRVLGTTFLVRRYATDTTVTVAVHDGKVVVGSTVLTRGGLVEVGRGGMVHVGSAEPWRFGFATGVLTLPSMRLAQAIPELNRWYNADIRLGDPSLATKLVEGTLTAGSLADLTAVLELTGVRVVRNDRTLTLYPR